MQDEGLLSGFLRDRRLAATSRILCSGSVLDYGCGDGTLAAIIPARRYLGVDNHPECLEAARERNPGHRFISPAELRDETQLFERIAGLAVIEHLARPAAWLSELRTHMAPGALIVLTTPPPGSGGLQKLGSRIGLLSRRANEQHVALLGRSDLDELAAAADLELVDYRRFLLGFNQRAILRRR